MIYRPEGHLYYRAVDDHVENKELLFAKNDTTGDTESIGLGTFRTHYIPKKPISQ
jgi:hypothetical protein